jgi:hypothetical protein
MRFVGRAVHINLAKRGLLLLDGGSNNFLKNPRPSSVSLPAGKSVKTRLIGTVPFG